MLPAAALKSRPLLLLRAFELDIDFDLREWLLRAFVL